MVLWEILRPDVDFYVAVVFVTIFAAVIAIGGRVVMIEINARRSQMLANMAARWQGPFLPAGFGGDPQAFFEHEGIKVSLRIGTARSGGAVAAFSEVAALLPAGSAVRFALFSQSMHVRRPRGFSAAPTGDELFDHAYRLFCPKEEGPAVQQILSFQLRSALVRFLASAPAAVFLVVENGMFCMRTQPPLEQESDFVVFAKHALPVLHVAVAQFRKRA